MADDSKAITKQPQSTNCFHWNYSLVKQSMCELIIESFGVDSKYYYRINNRRGYTFFKIKGQDSNKNITLCEPYGFELCGRDKYKNIFLNLIYEKGYCLKPSHLEVKSNYDGYYCDIRYQSGLFSSSYLIYNPFNQLIFIIQKVNLFSQHFMILTSDRQRIGKILLHHKKYSSTHFIIHLPSSFNYQLKISICSAIVLIDIERRSQLQSSRKLKEIITKYILDSLSKIL